MVQSSHWHRDTPSPNSWSHNRSNPQWSPSIRTHLWCPWAAALCCHRGGCRTRESPIELGHWWAHHSNGRWRWSLKERSITSQTLRDWQRSIVASTTRYSLYHFPRDQPTRCPVWVLWSWTSTAWVHSCSMCIQSSSVPHTQWLIACPHLCRSLTEKPPSNSSGSRHGTRTITARDWWSSPHTERTRQATDWKPSSLWTSSCTWDGCQALLTWAHSTS